MRKPLGDRSLVGRHREERRIKKEEKERENSQETEQVFIILGSSNKFSEGSRARVVQSQPLPIHQKSNK